MSLISGFRMMSSSTAKMWSLAVPFVALRSPRYWPALADERFKVGASTKASPWSVRPSTMDTMANTKDAEKDRATVVEEFVVVLMKLSGAGWKAWPFPWEVELVRARRPLGMTTERPSRVRFAAAKPW
jgi:hypothetical protein